MPTAAEVLDIAKRAATQGRIELLAHARKEMREAGAQREDVRAALESATAATFDPARGTWKLTGGTDIDGDGLVVVIAIEDGGVRVVTVW